MSEPQEGRIRSKEEAIAEGQEILDRLSGGLGLGTSRVQVVNVRYGFGNHPNHREITKAIDRMICAGFQLQSQVEQPPTFMERAFFRFSGSTRLTFTRAPQASPAIRPSTPGRFCGSCGSPLALEDRFCTGCGAGRR